MAADNVTKSDLREEIQNILKEMDLLTGTVDAVKTALLHRYGGQFVASRRREIQHLLMKYTRSQFQENMRSFAQSLITILDNAVMKSADERLVYILEKIKNETAKGEWKTAEYVAKLHKFGKNHPVQADKYNLIKRAFRRDSNFLL